MMGCMPSMTLNMSSLAKERPDTVKWKNWAYKNLLCELDRSEFEVGSWSIGEVNHSDCI